MKEMKTFEIPGNQEAVVKLIESIPLDWAWLDGALNAPENLVKSGSAEKATGFYIGRFHSIKPTVIGVPEEKPDLYAIIVGRKLPGFVLFEEAGFEDKFLITLKLAKNIVIGFIRKGYTGRLHFYKGYRDNNKFDNPARCEIVFNSKGSYISLEWNSNYGGREEHIEPIVKVCGSLGLKERKLEKLEV